ncbi:hypothetical protein [Actinoplanes sp. NPDC049265]|uniref:hypothetical protein n=1 Tax=Actinoplanes sp. NPDC049265 TaxID=3363902 RepID=UPI003718131C
MLLLTELFGPTVQEAAAASAALPGNATPDRAMAPAAAKGSNLILRIATLPSFVEYRGPFHGMRAKVGGSAYRTLTLESTDARLGPHR